MAASIVDVTQHLVKSPGSSEDVNAVICLGSSEDINAVICPGSAEMSEDVNAVICLGSSEDINAVICPGSAEMSEDVNAVICPGSSETFDVVISAVPCSSDQTDVTNVNDTSKLDVEVKDDGNSEKVVSCGRHPEEVSRSVSELPTTCDKHKGMELIYVCEECFNSRPLVCSECVVTVHKGHTLGLLTSFAAHKRKQILKFVEDAGAQYSKKCEETIVAVDNQIQQEDEYTKRLVYEIRKSSDDLKTRLEGDAEEKRSKCQLFKKQNTEALNQYKAEKLSWHKKAKEHLEECRQIMERNNDAEVFLFVNGILSPVKVSEPVLSKQVFRRPDNAGDVIAKVCGDLMIDGNQNGEHSSADLHKDHIMNATDEQMSSSSLPADGTFQKSKKDTCVFPEVPHSICSTPSGYLWIKSADNMSVIHLDRKGKVLSILDCSVEITAMSFSSFTDNIWVAGKDRSIRELITPNPVLVRFFVDDCVTCLSATWNGTVMVGMPSLIKAYTVRGVPLYQTRTSGLFTSALINEPIKIAECHMSRHLAVINRKRQRSRDGPKRWVIVGLDDKLKPKFQHEIRNVNNPEQRFEPLDLCFNHGIMFVLTKCKNIYVIDSDGTSGKFLRRTFDKTPVSLARASNTMFVVGFQSKEVMFFQLKNCI